MIKSSFYVFLISIIGYFFIYSGAGMVNEEGKDTVHIPTVLRKVLFPFLRNEKISIMFIWYVLYLFISNIYIYLKYLLCLFLHSSSWNWENVNKMWTIITFAALYIGAVLLLLIMAIKEEKKLLKALLVIGDVVLILGGIYYFITPLWN